MSRFVSHCATQARREAYVKKLSKHVQVGEEDYNDDGDDRDEMEKNQENLDRQVDVYGKCGKLKCSRDNETECFLMLDQDYKFYLSFENSLCEDYVTEKFFNMLK